MTDLCSTSARRASICTQQSHLRKHTLLRADAERALISLGHSTVQVIHMRLYTQALRWCIRLEIHYIHTCPSSFGWIAVLVDTNHTSGIWLSNHHMRNWIADWKWANQRRLLLNIRPHAGRWERLHVRTCVNNIRKLFARLRLFNTNVHAARKTRIISTTHALVLFCVMWTKSSAFAPSATWTRKLSVENKKVCFLVFQRGLLATL
jgi:hypothetical protein